MLSAYDVKYYSSLKQKRYRKKENKFLIEGFHLIEECLNSSYNIELIVLSDVLKSKADKLLFEKARRRNVPVEYVSNRLFNKLSETENSQGIVGVVFQNESVFFYDRELNKPLVALDCITDPGNLGTIIRTAYWFNIDCILIGKGSVDVYNSKVLRSSQGSIFHISVFENLNLVNELSKLTRIGYNIYLFSAKGKDSLTRMRFSPNSVFVFGNESEGISKEIINSSYNKVKIDGFSKCESLNVAVSCGIVFNSFRNNIK
ncbi:MAG: TrmH family RNA methyltransferase [Ignavibacteria bacterium]